MSREENQARRRGEISESRGARAERLQAERLQAERTERVQSADSLAHTAREQSRDVTRFRMRELAQRIMGPSYPERAADVAELDRLWDAVTRWNS